VLLQEAISDLNAELIKDDIPILSSDRTSQRKFIENNIIYERTSDIVLEKSEYDQESSEP
jgi:hypothetical protein